MLDDIKINGLMYESEIYSTLCLKNKWYVLLLFIINSGYWTKITYTTLSFLFYLLLWKILLHPPRRLWTRRDILWSEGVVCWGFREHHTPHPLPKAQVPKPEGTLHIWVPGWGLLWGIRQRHSISQAAPAAFNRASYSLTWRSKRQRTWF